MVVFTSSGLFIFFEVLIMGKRLSRVLPRLSRSLSGMLFLIALLAAAAAQAATYYVATTGNDTTGNGSSGSPWATPQKCVTQVAAGDTCTVNDGIYTDTGSDGRTVLITSSNSVSGTSSDPITLKSTNPNGAKIVVRTNLNQNQAGIYLSGLSWWIIEGFEIYDDGRSTQGANAAIVGIYLYGTSTSNITVRKNKIHNIGRAVCSESLYGNVGILLGNTSKVVIEQNQLYTIGRLRNGESGCSTTIFQHDHGIYADSTENLTILRNVFYDTNRGMPIVLKAYAGSTKHTRIFHNTIAGKSPTGVPAGQISLVNVLDDIQIKNNIFYDPPGYVFWWHTTSSIVPTSPGVVIQYNLSNSTQSTILNPNFLPSSGITYTNITLNTYPGFLDATANNFVLTSGSSAIDRGTNVGLPFSGSAPDIGAYEHSDPNSDPPPVSPIGLRIQ